MNDKATILWTAPRTARLLKWLDKLTKVGKDENQALEVLESLDQEGSKKRQHSVAGGEKIPLLAEQPIHSLGRQHTPELSDRQMERKAVQKELTKGLAKTAASFPGS